MALYYVDSKCKSLISKVLHQNINTIKWYLNNKCQKNPSIPKSDLSSNIQEPYIDALKV